MPALVCIIEREILCVCVSSAVSIARVCVSQRATVSGRRRGCEWVSEVCVTRYTMCFQKPLGVKPSSNAIKSMMGNGSFRTAGLCKTHGTTWTHFKTFFFFFFTLPKPAAAIWIALTRRVGPRVAFCVFDLRINWARFRLMRSTPHSFALFSISGS